ncbi:MAG: sodium:solute symporter family protein [Bacteroidota bacterium]
MAALDYLTIVLFSIIIVVAGLSFGRSASDMKSYFAAGGAVPWTISGLSLFMSFFSAGTFVVWGSIAYEAGLVSISIQWMMCLGGLLVGLFIAAKWRKTNVLTAAEFIRLRLGKNTQQFYTYLILVLSLVYAGQFLYPVAKLVNVSTGFSINGCIVILGLVIMLYTVVGGLWAVIITDVLQFVILTAAVLIVVPLAIQKVGGLDTFVKEAPSNFFQYTNSEYTLGFLIAFGIYNMIFIGGNWAYVQRYTSVSNASSAKKVGYLFAALYLIAPLLWMLPPMLYRTINTDLSGLANEGAYLLVCKEVLPIGMLGLILGGMIFATASSVNTTLNLLAAVVTNDVFKPLRPNATLKSTMWVARISTLVLGLFTIGIALIIPLVGGIVEVVLSVGAVTGCSLYGPPIWALFSKRQTGLSIMWCTIISLGINVFFKFAAPLLIGFGLTRGQEMLLGAITPFVLLGAYELWAIATKKVSQQYVIYTYQRSTYSDMGALENDASTQNQYGLKVLAYTLGVVGIVVLVLGFIAQKAVLLVGLMGTMILLIGIILHPKINLNKTEDLRKEKSDANYS